MACHLQQMGAACLLAASAAGAAEAVNRKPECTIHSQSGQHGSTAGLKAADRSQTAELGKVGAPPFLLEFAVSLPSAMRQRSWNTCMALTAGGAQHLDVLQHSSLTPMSRPLPWQIHLTASTPARQLLLAPASPLK